MNKTTNKASTENISQLHARNKHQGRYDFDQLLETLPALSSFVRVNEFNDKSIDFSNPEAVKTLNQALLANFYGISNWSIPKGYLCPPIPGRADYIHYIADLLADSHSATNALGRKVRVLDIGAGANVIYPLIGFREYGWRFVGADIDKVAINNAQYILNNNMGCADAITLRLQNNQDNIFKNVIQVDDKFDLTMCNPPFHASLKDALAGTQRKWQNLAISQTKNTGKQILATNVKNNLNFGGQAAELYCTGGEEAFITRMITESVGFKTQCLWFTTLISKATTLPTVYRTLKKVNALQVKTIEMKHGQKKSRIVAWSFLNKQQDLWHK